MPCGHFFPLPASKKPDACPKDLCPVSPLALQEASGSLPRLFPVSSAARMTGPCLHPHLRFPVCPGISVPEPFTKPAAFFRAGAFSEQAFDKGGALWNSAPCRQCFPFPSGLLPNVRGRGRLVVCLSGQLARSVLLSGRSAPSSCPHPRCLPMARLPWQQAQYAYFAHRDCEYFPCHPGADPDNFNCLFCYCPLYVLGRSCGGNFTYRANGIKDCSQCLFPHKRENYEKVVQRYRDIVQVMHKADDPSS